MINAQSIVDQLGKGQLVSRATVLDLAMELARLQQPAAVPTQYGLAAYAQANADFRPAPVPAAGVQGKYQSNRETEGIIEALRVTEDESALWFSAKEMRGILNLWTTEKDHSSIWKYRAEKAEAKLAATTQPDAAGVHDAQEQIHIGTRLRRVAKAAGVTVDYGDDAFYYACAFSILGDIARTLEKPAAGAQGDRRKLIESLTKEDFEALPEGVLMDLGCRACTVSRQPDSGRDAALVRAGLSLLKYLDDHDWGGVPEGETSNAFRAALAAHPAPSSDAALEFHRGVIAALGALAPHSQHGDVLHDEIVASVGKEALYKAAEPDDLQWAGLDPIFYATVKP